MKMKYIYTMKNYSVVNKNEAMKFEGNWMELESSRVK